MNNRELVLDAMRRNGKMVATDLQNRSANLTGTALNSEADYLPSFNSACQKMNMIDRPVGFVCKSSAGRIVRLIQPYDSTIYPQEPESLPAHWGFVWSNDPAHALPFLAITTSPYMKGNCCTEGDQVWRSIMDNNVFAPSEYPQGWEQLYISFT